jgi:hypothetical protein
MTMNAKELAATIDEVLGPAGFEKRKSTWFRHHPETVLVVDLQKSDYGGQFYVNLGIGLRALGLSEWPREEHCHIRVRLERVLSRADTENRAFDLEDRSLPDDIRRLIVQDRIAKGAQWLAMLSTTNAIVQLLSSKKLIRNHSTVQARRFLGID